MKLLKYTIPVVVFLTVIAIACSNTLKKESEENLINTNSPKEKPSKALSEAFKKYWYAGKAELTSYELTQARYGELREGKAVLVYVTEDFLPEVQVKADRRNANNIPVLKLNATKNFLTGIYPYSIMTSTFYPVKDNRHAIKISTSMQEWCGHIYTQLNNRGQFDITSHSYFEGEADKSFSIEKTLLENEIWNKIRINPEELPVGDNLMIIPSLEYTRLKHVPVKAYAAKATMSKEGDFTNYSIEYAELNRTLSIQFNTAFPHEIEGWTETFKSGFGPKAKQLTTSAKKIKSIKSAYWGKNSNIHLPLRDSLGI